MYVKKHFGTIAPPELTRICVHVAIPQNQHLQQDHQQHVQNHQQTNLNNQHIQMQPTPVKIGRGGKDNKPRGRMTAYAFFVQTCREEHKKKHPEESVIFAEFSRKCAERWKVTVASNFICIYS